MQMPLLQDRKQLPIVRDVGLIFDFEVQLARLMELSKAPTSKKCASAPSTVSKPSAPSTFSGAFYQRTAIRRNSIVAAITR
jgi:hypothetical protein